MVRVLELFCGTKSVSKVWEAYEGWDIVSVDIDPKANPTICTDVMNWDYASAFPVGYFDIIWASPPCTTFSKLRATNIGRSRLTKESIEDDITNIGVPILRRTEDIIAYFAPRFWFMENPATGRMRNYTRFTKFTDVTYCAYGFPYKKLTRIWTNTDYVGKRCACKNHPDKIGRSGVSRRVSTTYRIPPLLIDEIGEFVSCHFNT